MNTEYVWWVVVLLLVGGGAIGFLALGKVPEIEDEPVLEPASDLADAAEPRPSRGPDDGYSPPVSTTVPGPDVPTSTSETP